MRPVLQGLVTLIAALTINAPSGYAYPESFFHKRYCAMGGGSQGSAFPDCSFNTWEQCRLSAFGLGRYCAENPFWKSEDTGGKERTRPHRTRQ